MLPGSKAHVLNHSTLLRPRAVVRGDVQSGNGQDSLSCRKGMDRGGSLEMDTLGCPRGALLKILSSGEHS